MMWRLTGNYVSYNRPMHLWLLQTRNTWSHLVGYVLRCPAKRERQPSPEAAVEAFELVQMCYFYELPRGQEYAQ